MLSSPLYFHYPRSVWLERYLLNALRTKCKSGISLVKSDTFYRQLSVENLRIYKPRKREDIPVLIQFCLFFLLLCRPSLRYCKIIKHCCKYLCYQQCGGGNGTPLQYSCLENPMDRGAWQAQSMGSQRVGHD